MLAHKGRSPLLSSTVTITERMVEAEVSLLEDAESDEKARDTRYVQATRRDEKMTVKCESVLHKIPFQLLLKGRCD